MIWHITASNMGAHYTLSDQEAEEEYDAIAQARAESRRNNWGMDILYGLAVKAYPCSPRHCGAYHQHRNRRATA